MAKLIPAKGRAFATPEFELEEARQAYYNIWRLCLPKTRSVIKAANYHRCISTIFKWADAISLDYIKYIPKLCDVRLIGRVQKCRMTNMSFRCSASNPNV